MRRSGPEPIQDMVKVGRSEGKAAFAAADLAACLRDACIDIGGSMDDDAPRLDIAVIAIEPLSRRARACLPS